MHNLDALQEASFEAAQEYQFDETAQEDEEALNEADELEAASELMGVSSEDELDQFLGSFIKKIGRSVGKAVNATTGNSLGGLLKGLAKKSLPFVTRAVGGAIGGPLGGMVAGKLGDVAAQTFGLELEGLSAEDQELEVARRFVRLANHATRRSLRTGPRGVRSSMQSAMRRFAPGFGMRRFRNGGGGFNGFGGGYYGPQTVYVPQPCNCGATHAEPAADAAPVEATPAPAAAAGEFEFEDEGAYESPGEFEGSDEFEASAELGQSGRWYRRGGRIVLVGA